MIIQIYEIQTPEEASQMIDLGVDHIGSVLLSSNDWKNPVLKSTIQRVKIAGCKSSLIPLFTQVNIISEALAYYQPDIVHFCETLPLSVNDTEALKGIVDRQIAIRQKFPELEIMRSIPIASQGHGDLVPSLAVAGVFEPYSDWFLTDTLKIKDKEPLEKEQPVAGFIGITGQTCDWKVARALVRQSRIPVILAGGIGPENVADGIAQVGPWGVDSCTLTNRVDAKGCPIRFKKDPDKVRAMVQTIRSP